MSNNVSIFIYLLSGVGAVVVFIFLLLFFWMGSQRVNFNGVSSFSFLGFGIAKIPLTKSGDKVRKALKLANRKYYFILPKFIAIRTQGVIVGSVFDY